VLQVVLTSMHLLHPGLDWLLHLIPHLDPWWGEADAAAVP
jgi:hypothetical protein